MKSETQRTITCCVIMVALSNGSYLTMSNYLIPLRDTLGLTMAQVSSIHVTSGLINMLCSLFLGWTLGKIKSGAMMSISGGCLCLFYIGISLSKNIEGLLVSAVPFGFAMVWGGYGVCQTVLENVGGNKSGKIMSLLPVGAGMGAFMMSPLIALGIGELGLRKTALIQGCMCGGTMLILGLLQLRRERKNKAIAAGTDQESPGHWMAARKTPGFWMVLVGSFMFLLASGGFAGNAAPIYEQMGCTTMEASFAISVRSVVQLGWALLFGVLADRHGPVPAVGLYCATAAAAFGFAVMLRNFTGAVIVAALNGSMSIGASIGAVCFARMFNGKVGGMILGLSNAMLGLSLTCGSPLAAAMLDITGSYNMFLFCAIGMTAGCWVLVWFALREKACGEIEILY